MFAFLSVVYHNFRFETDEVLSKGTADGCLLTVVYVFINSEEFYFAALQEKWYAFKVTGMLPNGRFDTDYGISSDLNSHVWL